MKNISRPVIGVLGVPEYDFENTVIVSMFNGYKNAIVEKGGIPVMITPYASIDYYGTRLRDLPEITEEEKAFYRDMVDLCDGIIAPGGYRLYNWHEYILRYAIEQNKPVLGTCVGMQMLAKIDNGDHLVEEITTSINHKVKGVDYAHDVEIQSYSVLKDIFKDKEISVNSQHKFGISKINNFQVSAYSPDGVIEAIELPSKNFVVGVQWHPEQMISYDENSNRLFERFSEECKSLRYKR